jgi:DNA relaxase NicK
MELGGSLAGCQKALRKGVRSMAKKKAKKDDGRAKLAVLKASVGKAAYGYTDTSTWGRVRERAGNKGGTLSNRLRAVMSER